ncbi:MAG: phosphoribosyltransferase [Candidatus Saccharimonadales bacterium]
MASIISFSQGLREGIDKFKQDVLSGRLGVLDAEGLVYHEFESGVHGRKLDMEKLTRGSRDYQWFLELFHLVINEVYGDNLPDAVLGVANGGNNLAMDTSQMFNDKVRRVRGLTTIKPRGDAIYIPSHSTEIIKRSRFGFVLVIEDVGTTGGSSAGVASQLYDLDVPRVEVFNGWQRSEHLPVLESMGIVRTYILNVTKQFFIYSLS